MRERKSEYVSLSHLPEEYRRPGDEVSLAQRASVQRMIDEEQLMCRTCGNSFRSGRPRCPTCGTVPRVAKTPKFRNTARVRNVPVTACVECKLRGAKIECEQCGNRLHPGCFTLHQCEGVRDEIRSEGGINGTHHAEGDPVAASSDAAHG